MGMTACSQMSHSIPAIAEAQRKGEGRTGVPMAWRVNCRNRETIFKSTRMGARRMHLCRENFEHRIACEVADVPSLIIRDLGSGVSCLEDFLEFIGLREWPAIQLSI